MPRLGRESVPRVDDGIVHDPPSESDTGSVEFRPRRKWLVLCSQSGSLPLPVEAGSRQGNTEMEAEDTTDPVQDPLFVLMAGAMAFGLQSLDGHGRLWPHLLWPIFRPTLANQTDFGQFWCFRVLTDFGQTDFGQF